MTDPLDTPPTDYGSDRYDYVEVSAPSGVRPLGQWWDDLIATPCSDCRANVFATFIRTGLGDEWSEIAWDPRQWKIVIAHDETCTAVTE